MLLEGRRLDEMGAPDADIEEWAERAQASEHKLAAQLSEWRTEPIGVRANTLKDQAVVWKLTDC
ncbi:MAG TPA: hypothetical protein VEG40_05385 [Gaiellaceae bacterium]|nr:hypothetical protein [Gaiellaceae bacterium]